MQTPLFSSDSNRLPPSSSSSSSSSSSTSFSQHSRSSSPSQRHQTITPSSRSFKLLDLSENGINNLDSADVLQLYRGWRKAENLLKDREKELQGLREKVSLLQSSNSRFRGQLQALESIKELVVDLQDQLSKLEKENVRLTVEKKELHELQMRTEQALHEKRSSEEWSTSERMEAATLRGRYEEVCQARKEVELMLADEQIANNSLEQRLKEVVDTCETLRQENKTLRIKLDKNAARSKQYDDDLRMASDQLSLLATEVNEMHSRSTAAFLIEAENTVLKADISRLLRLMEHYPAFRGFLRRWQDNEGLHFIGDVDFSHSTVPPQSTLAQSIIRQHNTVTPGKSFNSAAGAAAAATTTPSKGLSSSSPTSTSASPPAGAGAGAAVPSPNNETLSALYDGEAWKEHGMTPAELSQLRHIHVQSGQTQAQTPLPYDMLEESEGWVGDGNLKEGFDFFVSNVPNAPVSILIDFLKRMNKIWLQRERKRIQKIKDDYDHTIKDLKRQLANNKPYQQQMAEKKIRRLSFDIKRERAKNIYFNISRQTGKKSSKRSHKEGLNSSDNDPIDALGSLLLSGDETSNTIKVNSPHNKRLCEIIKEQQDSFIQARAGITGAEQRAAAEGMIMEAMSAQKLLEAIDRQGHDGVMKLTNPEPHPTEQYLKGALWLGRNLSILIQDSIDKMEAFRTYHLSAVAKASLDKDLQSAAHRLALLCSSGVSEALHFANQTKKKTKGIIDALSSVSPGDVGAYAKVSAQLPIDAAFESTPSWFASTLTTPSSTKKSTPRTPAQPPPPPSPSPSWAATTINSAKRSSSPSSSRGGRLPPTPPPPPTFTSPSPQHGKLVSFSVGESHLY